MSSAMGISRNDLARYLGSSSQEKEAEVGVEGNTKM